MKAEINSRAGIALAKHFNMRSIDMLSKIRCLSVDLYDQDRFVVILNEGGTIRDHRVNNICGTVLQKMELLAKAESEKGSIKVEGVEKLFTFATRACNELAGMTSLNVDLHVFMSWPGSVSFPMHVDHEDIYMLLVKGKKRVFFDNQESILLQPFDCLYVPKGVAHRSETIEDTLLLSFGCTE